MPTNKCCRTMQCDVVWTYIGCLAGRLPQCSCLCCCDSSKVVRKQCNALTANAIAVMWKPSKMTGAPLPCLSHLVALQWSRNARDCTSHQDKSRPTRTWYTTTAGLYLQPDCQVTFPQCCHCPADCSVDPCVHLWLQMH